MTTESSIIGYDWLYEVIEYSCTSNELYKNVRYYRGSEEQITQIARFFLATREDVEHGSEITWTFTDQRATPKEHRLQTETTVYWVTARKISSSHDLHFTDLSAEES